jgi:hypothetical protein
MKKELFSCTALIGFSSLVVILTLATFVQAQDIEKWTGTVSFTLKAKIVEKNTVTGIKTSNETFAGTINVYYDAITLIPTPGPDGCILELLGNNGTNICFTDLAGPGSAIGNRGKGSVFFVGTGNIAGTFTGIAYINGKGSVAFDNGSLSSFHVGGIVGAGGWGSPGGQPDFVLSGTIPTTALAK